MGSISVKNLGKAYKQYPSRWARLREWFLLGTIPQHQQHWVLKDINIEIGAGESVGIVGVNGAGKSTLLKMITGTTVATEGQIHVEGHVAALLELGMGFHPEFTGRQNAFMAGQLMGLSVSEIETTADSGIRLPGNTVDTTPNLHLLKNFRIICFFSRSVIVVFLDKLHVIRAIK